MGVYIKGMEMPELEIGKAIKMEICNDNGVMRIGIMTGGYPCCEEWTYYEASEVPEPHGRLIDETEIKTIYWQDSIVNHCWESGGKLAFPYIDAPTVIEAEGE